MNFEESSFNFLLSGLSLDEANLPNNPVDNWRPRHSVDNPISLIDVA